MKRQKNKGVPRRQGSAKTESGMQRIRTNGKSSRHVRETQKAPHLNCGNRLANWVARMVALSTNHPRRETLAGWGDEHSKTAELDRATL